MNVYLDFETRSYLDLEVVGLDNYAKHRSTEVLLLGYAYDDGPIDLWRPHCGQIPNELRNAIFDPANTLVAWNSSFERYIFKYVLKTDLPANRWEDPMIRARYLSLPGSLLAVSEILGLKEDEAKIADGKRLIQKFCYPFRMGGENTLFGVTEPEYHDWNTSPADWALFEEYCKHDVEAERALLKRFSAIQFPERERRGWLLDQKINDRGMPVNRQRLGNMLGLVERVRKELRERQEKLTGLANPNSRDQLLPWVKERGYKYESLRKEFVSAALAGATVTKECREVLELRRELAKTSYMKLERIKDQLSEDGRLRHQFLFMGAARTGRWSGGGVQVHNMPRPSKEVESNYDRALEIIDAYDYEAAAKEFKKEILPGVSIPQIIGMVSSCIRSVFEAEAGKKFVICDKSGIETRAAAYLAQCEPLLEVFRQDKDPYISFATEHMYHVPYEVLLAAVKRKEVAAKEKRQVAKSAVLGAVYGLGHGTEMYCGKRVAIVKQDSFGNDRHAGLIAYAENMGITISPDQSYLAVTAFRSGYHEIEVLWHALEEGAIAALKYGDNPIVGPVQFSRIRCKNTKQFILRITLPSGRALHYINARVIQETRINKKGEEYVRDVIMYDGIGHGVGAVKEDGTRGSTGDTTGTWGPTYIYGGKFLENIDQAFSRDDLLDSMFRADELGINLVGHFHDELLAEETEDGFGLDDLRYCMSTSPDWAPDFLIAADGFESKVYKKG